VRVRAGLWRVPPELAEVLVMRMGWAEGESGGGPPRTLAEVARLRGVTPGRVSRLEHRAMRLALGLAAPAGGRSEGEAAGAGRG
jgi:DNA-directed RNA polymerase sigma subunit (sigma70/sigma32)